MTNDTFLNVFMAAVVAIPGVALISLIVDAFAVSLCREISWRARVALLLSFIWVVVWLAVPLWRLWCALVGF